MPIVDRIAEVANEIAAWRQDIHAHPELMYEVPRTAGLVARRLRAFGVDEVAEGVGRTGVVGLIRGRRGPGRAIGLRADMDALPITEAVERSYKSTRPGVMHACGHDGHTAMLLGAARQLAESRAFAGSVVVIFQPAEEGGAGARAMIEDGLFERFPVDEVYGMHNLPGLAVGRFSTRPGPLLAATDGLRIVVEGKGAHAARPHSGVDPVLVASHIVVALQSVVSRNVDPLESAVVSVTVVEAGTAENVIPQSVVLRGTIRTLSPAVRDLVDARVRAVAEGTAAAFGARATVTLRRGYPVTMNDPARTAFATEVAAGIAGAQAVDPAAAPIMGAEDFAYMLEKRPGAMVFLGNGDTADLHHPAYDFNDAAIPYGTSFWVRLAETALAG